MRNFEFIDEVQLFPKSFLEDFCQIPSVLVADVSPLSAQDDAHGFFCFSFSIPTGLVLKEEKIIFIPEVLKAVNLKCFLLHTTTKKVLKDNYKTTYFFGTIKRYNITVLSLKQCLGISQRCGPEVYLGEHTIN